MASDRQGVDQRKRIPDRAAQRSDGDHHGWDPNRVFPPDDPFLLADILDAINKKLELYREQQRKIIKTHCGSINEQTGTVEYPDPESQKKAVADFEKLHAVVVEIPGAPLERKQTWPRLTIGEASLLRPLTKKVPKGEQSDK